MTKVLFALAASGIGTKALIDYLLGKPYDAPEWSDLGANLLRTFGLSNYVLDKVRAGKPGEAVTAFASPPLNTLVDIAKGDFARYVPGVGKVLFEQERTRDTFLGVGGKAKGEEKRYQERLREIKREQPWFGKTPRAVRERMQDERDRLREQNPRVIEEQRERRRQQREELER